MNEQHGLTPIYICESKKCLQSFLFQFDVSLIIAVWKQIGPDAMNCADQGRIGEFCLIYTAIPSCGQSPENGAHRE
ncbi:MAG TPA: hypothetical protein DDW27_02315 [Bacteroidales bacterium]|nr:hypothetical protein [Bacteroidales bacterium]